MQPDLNVINSCVVCSKKKNEVITKSNIKPLPGMPIQKQIKIRCQKYGHIGIPLSG